MENDCVPLDRNECVYVVYFNLAVILFFVHSTGCQTKTDCIRIRDKEAKWAMSKSPHMSNYHRFDCIHSPPKRSFSLSWNYGFSHHFVFTRERTWLCSRSFDSMQITLKRFTLIWNSVCENTYDNSSNVD